MIAEKKTNFIDAKDCKPSRSPATESIIDRWEYRMNILRDLTEILPGSEAQSKFLESCVSTAERLNEDVLWEQVIIRRANDQLRLMTEARDVMLNEIQELSDLAKPQ
jgi:hypothetical protein